MNTLAIEIIMPVAESVYENPPSPYAKEGWGPIKPLSENDRRLHK